MFNISTRDAKLSDHEAVNELSSGIHESTDITQNLFPAWVNDSLWLPYVAETNSGHIVGFLALNITDCEQSVVERSSRVAEQFRGHGIYKQMLNSALKFAKQKLPSLNCIIRARQPHIAVAPGYKVLQHCSKIVFSCKLSPTDDVVLPSDILNTTIPSFYEQQLTAENVAKLYEEDETIRKLFVGGIITIEAEAFHTSNMNNWTYLQKRKGIFFTITKYHPNSTNTGAVLSVLCLSCKKTNDGKPYITINIFGQEASMIRHHIFKAMKQARLYAGCDYNLGVFVDTELEKSVSGIAKEGPYFCHKLCNFELVYQEADYTSHFQG